MPEKPKVPVQIEKEGFVRDIRLYLNDIAHAWIEVSSTEGLNSPITVQYDDSDPTYLYVESVNAEIEITSDAGLTFDGVMGGYYVQFAVNSNDLTIPSLAFTVLALEGESEEVVSGTYIYGIDGNFHREQSIDELHQRLPERDWGEVWMLFPDYLDTMELLRESFHPESLLTDDDDGVADGSRYDV